ncbi:MAG: hypothetical protein KGJ90_06795 [Patescibacteria group bacterium]|nr:hypothetical protein [Patescibacteria group bacterium]
MNEYEMVMKEAADKLSSLQTENSALKRKLELFDEMFCLLDDLHNYGLTKLAKESVERVLDKAKELK